LACVDAARIDAAASFRGDLGATAAVLTYVDDRADLGIETQRAGSVAASGRKTPASLLPSPASGWGT